MQRLRDYFKTAEIASSKTLQSVFWVFLALILLDLIPQSQWSRGILATDKNLLDYVCWPHFQNCSQFLVLNAPPVGISYALLMVGLFLAAAFAARSALNNCWGQAQLGLGLLVSWKIFYHFFWQQSGQANFQYYTVPLMLVWLFSTNKENLMRICFVVLYTFAATVKFQAGWIEGTYFSSLYMGLPLVPDISDRILIPVVTNLVIVFEIVFSWLLLSSHPRWQRVAFWGWISFHIYSILLVGFHYPIHCLPLLYLLFNRSTAAALTSLRAVRPGGFILLAMISVLHLVFPLNALMTARDLRWSGENHQYGLGMIEGNYQCHIRWTVFGANDEILDQRQWSSKNASVRCPVYRSWFKFNQQCKADPRITRISYRHDLSLDGSPFYRIVDLPNACAVSYSSFTPNTWVQLPEQGALITGYPRPNGIRHSDAIPGAQRKIIYENPIENPPARPLKNHRFYFQIFYWILWMTVGGFSLSRLWLRPDPTEKHKVAMVSES